MNIGTHLPTCWQGDWPTPFLRFSEEVNPGINGKTRMEDAWDSEDAQVETYLLVESEAVKTQTVSKILAMQGYTVPVVDQHSIPRGNCLILRAVSSASMVVGGKWLVHSIFQIAPEIIVPEGWKDQVL